MSSIQEKIEQHEKELVKKLGNYKDLASMLGITINKAQQLMRRNDAPVVRIGRSKYVILSKVDNWLDEMLNNNEWI